MVPWLDMKDKRFVIQEHQTSEGVHWDLMLEQDDVLTTFRLPVGRASALALSCGDARPTRAERIFDHPLRFLWYEGPVQNGTGRVRIVDRGTWSAPGTVQACDFGAAISDSGFESNRQSATRNPQSAIHLVFDGAILHGAFALTRITETEWRFTCEPGVPDNA
jgi:hypothetical protein